MLPSIFNDNLFDDFFEFPFFDDRAERKLYGHNAKNIMKTEQSVVQRKNFTDIMLTTL